MVEKAADVDAYLAGLAEPARSAVARIRAVVHEAVPGLEEDIRYSMPTFTRDGRSVMHVAGWKNHVSIYPEPAGDADLAADLAPYAAGKGTLKLPLDQEIPDELVARIARALAVPGA